MSSYQNKIELKNVSKSFSYNSILENINIEVKEGQTVAIIGPSGSGKSTIFNILTRSIKEDSGSVLVNGDISYMYQKDMMVPWKKVIDNIGMPLVFKGKNRNEARTIVKEYIKDFGLLGYELKYPKQLSGGMKQRANFLKTYLTSKDIMLLDEPFGALDSITRWKMQKWLLNLKENINSTILLITHDIEEAIILSDKIYVISDKPARIKKEIIVDINKDDNLVTSDEFIKLKKQILELM